jgi:cytochrome bd-type quinol oxidase subunit 2
VGETPEGHYEESLRRQEIATPDDASLTELAEQGRIAQCLGPAGTVVFFDSNIMHGSGSNITPYPRRNVFMVYNSVSNALGVLTLLLAGSLWYVLKRARNDHLPFVFSIALFLLAYVGLAISVWPYLVPWRITLWEAASPESTQMFLLVGTLIIMPFVITYTALGYHVFRGKVKSDQGYH